MSEEADSMYLGIGFEWTQKHTQIAHEILRMPVTDIPVVAEMAVENRARTHR